MNDQTTKLIETLANKLGTTSEYLWGILIKQAPVSATIDLALFVFVILSGIVLYKVHKYLFDEESKISYYDNEFIIAVMLFAGLIWVVLALAAFFSIGNIINGYMNPEYWALDKVINSLK